MDLLMNKEFYSISTFTSLKVQMNHEHDDAVTCLTVSLVASTCHKLYQFSENILGEYIQPLIPLYYTCETSFKKRRKSFQV